MLEDLQDVLEDVIGTGRFALDNPWSVDQLKDIITRMVAQTRFALDLVIEQALCNPSPRDEGEPVLFEDDKVTG